VPRMMQGAVKRRYFAGRGRHRRMVEIPCVEGVEKKGKASYKRDVAHTEDI
jgi:hypothetical protein